MAPDPADPTSGHVYLGFRADASREAARGWVEAQDKAALLGAINQVPVRPGDEGVTRLLPAAADPFFRGERIEPAARPGGVRLDPQVAVLVVLDGHGQLRAGEGILPLARGTTVFVPGGAGQTSMDGPVTLLRCLPPDPGSAP